MILIENFITHYGENKQTIAEKINAIASSLSIDPNWLMMVFWQESRLNSKAVNTQKGDPTNPFIRAKTRATGLIQFMPQTAINLGTSTQNLYNMNVIEQLNYVHKYFYPFRGKIKSFHDLYLCTFFPLALGKNDNFVMQTAKLSPGIIASQNAGIDINKDGKITVAEFKEKIYSRVPQNLLPFIKKK